MKKFTTIDEAVNQVFDKENENELLTQILDDYGKQILKYLVGCSWHSYHYVKNI